ncbi:MAG: DNA cytosine methyltransferase, partial [Deltaproteobacteria bacterium]|nr:DNA cytosine methyltransferase [Deltaproteobacteria bacterium]
MDNTQELRTISLCTGYGGIERGIELCGERIKPVVTCEIEAYAIALNLKRMESGEVEAHPIWSDLKTFPVECIPKHFIDLITGGFPCQPFSTAGKRRSSEDPRHLWPYITRIIDAIKPVQCFFENVEGLVTAKTCEHLEEIQRVDDLISAERDPRTRWALSSWRERFYRYLLKTDAISALHLVICQLEELGYRATWGIFSAEEVGAPHRRRRIFILANRTDGRRRESPGPQIQGGSPEREGEQAGSNDARELPGGSKGYRGNVSNSPGIMRERALGPEEKGRVRSPDRNRQPSESEKMADTERPGLQECSDLDGAQRQAPGSDSGEEPARKSRAWPSCPGEPQYEWEPLRAVKAQPKVGRVPNGTSNTIDELRMLGNGVVPQT